MSEVFISYIIPCYKVEKYLPKCIESLSRQSIQGAEVEFVMVNDGSPDGCLDLISRFAEKDHRVIVVDQKNSGVSAARNSGTRASHGKYLFYLDGDDYLTDDASNILFEACSQSPDIVISNAWYVYEDNDGLKHEWNPCGRLMSGLYTTDIFVKQVKDLPSSFKAFKRELIINNNVNYDIELKTGEVFTFFIHALCYASKIAFTEKRTMCYLQRANSAMSCLNPKNDINILDTIHKIDNYVTRLKPELKDLQSYRFSVLSLANSFGILKYSSRTRIDNQIEIFLKQMRNDTVYHCLAKETVLTCRPFSRNYIYSLVMLCFPMRLAYCFFRVKNIFFNSIRQKK